VPSSLHQRSTAWFSLTRAGVAAATTLPYRGAGQGQPGKRQWSRGRRRQPPGTAPTPRRRCSFGNERRSGHPGPAKAPAKVFDTF